MSNFGVDPAILQSNIEFYLFLSICSVISVALVAFFAWALFGDRENK